LNPGPDHPHPLRALDLVFITKWRQGPTGVPILVGLPFWGFGFMSLDKTNAKFVGSLSGLSRAAFCAAGSLAVVRLTKMCSPAMCDDKPM